MFSLRFFLCVGQNIIFIDIFTRYSNLEAKWTFWHKKKAFD